MKINDDQLKFLQSLISEVTEQDRLGCDGCFALMDQFAEAMLSGDELSPTLSKVKVHLEQCRCCRDEYEALLTALREIAVISS